MLAIPVCIFGMAIAFADEPRTHSVPTRTADNDELSAVAEGQKDGLRMIAQNRFGHLSAQKELLDFLWVPGELIGQCLDKEVTLAYPE